MGLPHMAVRGKRVVDDRDDTRGGGGGLDPFVGPLRRTPSSDPFVGPLSRIGDTPLFFAPWLPVFGWPPETVLAFVGIPAEQALLISVI